MAMLYEERGTVVASSIVARTEHRDNARRKPAIQSLRISHRLAALWPGRSPGQRRCQPPHIRSGKHPHHGPRLPAPPLRVGEHASRFQPVVLGLGDPEPSADLPGE